MDTVNRKFRTSAEQLTLADRQEHQRYGRRVSFVIGLIGLGLLIAFNWNIHLQFTGIKYQATILSVEKQLGEEYLITIEYRKVDGLLYKKTFKDATQMASLVTYKKGEELTIWLAKTTDDSYYITKLHLATKLFILSAFVLVPFAFAIWGRVE